LPITEVSVLPVEIYQGLLDGAQIHRSPSHIGDSRSCGVWEDIGVALEKWTSDEEEGNQRGIILERWAAM